MGVLNVTPDSFSDGGRYADLDAAVRHGLGHVAEPARTWSTSAASRPARARTGWTPDEEIRRVLPAVRELAAAGVLVSVDTTRAAVAAAALDAGARIVNDVSGGLADPQMAKVVAAAGCPGCSCTGAGTAGTCRRWPGTATWSRTCATELSRQVDAALAAGVEPDRIVLDPGLGFAKTAEHNWALLARLDELVALGYPVLVGASRKSFLGRLLAGPDGAPAPVRPARGRDRGDRRAGRGDGRLGGPGARGPPDRGRDEGGRAPGRRPPSTPRPTGRSPGRRCPARAGPAVADRIRLTGLQVRGRHGVYGFERRDGQDFLVDATLWLDSRPAAASDDVADTVDYGVLAERIAAVVGGEPVNLIETLAARLAELCMARRAGDRGRGHRAQAAGADRPRVRRRGGDRPRPVPAGEPGRAVDRLQPRRPAGAPALGGGRAGPVAVSSVYETAPWGGVEQDDYLNAVVVVDDAGTDAYGWLRRARELEAAAGRVRDVRWGPRTLDVDVIDVDGTVSRRPGADPAAPAGARAGVRAGAVGGGGPGRGAGRPRPGGRPGRRGPPPTRTWRRRDDLELRRDSRPTRIRDLAGYAAGVTLLTWLALRQWYGELPELSWFLPLSPALLALAEVIAAGQLRARIRHRPGAPPVQPLVAARSLALAKASAVVGAVMTGVWAGLLVYVLPRLDFLAAAGGDARTGRGRGGRRAGPGRRRAVARILLPDPDTAGRRPAD